jgi:type IV secretion system protein TrbL
MTPDLGIMTQLLESFETAFKGGQADIGTYSLNLLWVLCGIELTLLGIYATIAGQEVVTPMFKKIMTVGFYLWVVKNFPYLTNEVLSGFTKTGMTAANNKSPEAILDPSGVLKMGFDVTKVVFEYMTQSTAKTYLGFSMDAFISGIIGVLILLAFFVIALQIFITRLEFALVVALGLILIPFGVLKQTAFIAEKVFGAILSFGVKLMVLTFICCISMPIIQSYTIPEGFVWDAMFNMFFAAATIACLAWHAPKITAGLLAGSPSLGGTGAITGAAALVGSYVAASKGAAAAVGGDSAVSSSGSMPGTGQGGGLEAMRVASGSTGGISPQSSAANSANAQTGASGTTSQNSSEGGLTTARSVKEGQGTASSGQNSSAPKPAAQSNSAEGKMSAQPSESASSSPTRATGTTQSGSGTNEPPKGASKVGRAAESASKAGKVDEEISAQGQKKGASQGNSSQNSSISNQASGSSLSSKVERSQGGNDDSGGAERSYSASALSTRSHPKGGSERAKGISGRVRSE